MNFKLGLRLAHRRSTMVGAIFVALAILIIGCGGGGGGGGIATTASNANGSSANGSSANGSSANGSSSGIGTTGSTAGVGSLPHNVIFYTQLTGAAGGAYDIRYISPTGANDATLVPNIPGTFELVAIDPNTGNYVFVAQSAAGANYGLYANSTVSLTGATTLVAPTFNDVASLSVSQDGTKIVLMAAPSATAPYSLYVIPSTGGLTSPIDSGNTSTISPDNDTIAYSNFVNNSFTQIFLYSISKGTTTQLTSDSTYHDYPQFSKDGTHLLYSKIINGKYSLVYSNGDGTVVVDIPNVSGLDERGGSLNPASSEIAFVGRSSSAIGLYTIGITGSNQTPLKTSQFLSSNGVYWTTGLGRGIGSPSLPASRIARMRHILQ